MDEETLNNLFDKDIDVIAQKVNPLCVCVSLSLSLSLCLSLCVCVLFLCQFYSAHHTSALTVEILTLTHLQS